MDILFSDNYRIKTDAYNYILQEKRYPDPNSKFTKDPNDWKWVDVSYHGKIGHLIDSLLEREIKQSDAEHISELYKLVCDIERNIVKTIENSDTFREVN